MTKIARAMPTFPRGTIMGLQTGCGGWFDMRDLGEVLDHEEPLPHAAQDQAQ
jgi:hypothetical protein